jgi:hypothetical protein
MPSARSILILWKPSSFMKCSWPGLMCALNRSVMRATSIALACSTVIRSGFGVALEASAGASIRARTAVVGFGHDVHHHSFTRPERAAPQAVAILLGAVFAVGGDQHVLVAILRHPAEIALALGHVEHALLVGDEVLLRVHDRHVHPVEQVERALDRPARRRDRASTSTRHV